MKYIYKNEIIPTEKRAEINEKILYLISNNLCEKYGITKGDVYNSYTGSGGLHGLNFKDFNSYYEFSEAKKKIENAQFFTPPELAKYLVDILKPSKHDLILDLTCGHGSFFNFLPNEFNVYGNELDMKAYKVAKYLYPNTVLKQGDMREYNPHINFDYVIGNPPFNLNLHYNGRSLLSQMVYIEKSLDLLKTGGILALIVPNSFLNDDFSNKTDIEYMDTNFNFICQIGLNNKEFEYLGVNNFSTKVIIFQKKSEHLEDKKYNLEMLDKIDPDVIYQKYLLPTYQEKEKLKNKIFLENVNLDSEDLDKEFQSKVKKLLFDIKRTKSISNKYAECKLYLDKYYNQKQPNSMDYQEWQKIRITKEKVIKYFKNVLSNQHTKEDNKVELVKWNYELKLKGYSEKNRLYIKSLKTNCMSFNDMILNNNYPFEDKKYYKLYIKKKKEYENQSRNFDNMQEDKSIKKWLDELTMIDYGKEEDIRLNDIQKNIVNKMLQKKYGYIQAEQGSGKTLMSICYALHRKQFTNVKNVFVVAPSIAINGTWITTLQDYKIPYIVLNKFTDIKNIKKGDFVLVTFNLLIKLQKRIKKYLKQINKNYVLLVDEADSICRIDSKRTKATLGTFKKARWKLLLSGTMTRNNITEAYTQFNLLYGSSINFLSKNEYILEEDEKTKELHEIQNKYYLKPFPEYKKGHKLFMQSFNPQKVTVFGVGQNTQNIYNSEILKKLINKTIITKTFEEVVGKKIYEIIQHTVKFNNSEKDLYYKAINEFYSMKYLFTSTGNPRKDRMMEIIQQITLLLNICQHPQTYREYNHLETPNKYKKVIELLKKWNNEQVSIGCRSLKEINCYSNLINKHFPNRKLFIITGSISMERRREIIKELKNYKDGILLCTQQSLSSSISIDYINKVIITALSWNFSSLSQFFFRFIRYTSNQHKEIHFITYQNSLESNLLGLIMAKENLTMFMKNKDVTDDELYEKFGVDFNLIDMLLTKERDSEGHTHIVNWGSQEIN
ncbi:DEAD/DEAH box helicase [Clostridium botulinum]|nr:DEAD/DEAH box helicase [Clostridium botulinum]